MQRERALVKARPSVSQARRQLNSWCGVCSLKPYYIVLQFLLSLSPNMRVCASLRLPSSSSFVHPVSSLSLSLSFLHSFSSYTVCIYTLALSLAYSGVCVSSSYSLFYIPRVSYRSHPPPIICLFPRSFGHQQGYIAI